MCGDMFKCRYVHMPKVAHFGNHFLPITAHFEMGMKLKLAETALLFCRVTDVIFRTKMEQQTNTKLTQPHPPRPHCPTHPGPTAPPTLAPLPHPPWPHPPRPHCPTHPGPTAPLTPALRALKSSCAFLVSLKRWYATSNACPIVVTISSA